MGVPDEDFAERSRSIFERLRAETSGEVDSGVSAESDVDADAADEADSPSEHRGSPPEGEPDGSVAHDEGDLSDDASAEPAAAVAVAAGWSSAEAEERPEPTAVVHDAPGAAGAEAEPGPATTRDGLERTSSTDGEPPSAGSFPPPEGLVGAAEESLPGHLAPDEAREDPETETTDGEGSAALIEGATPAQAVATEPGAPDPETPAAAPAPPAAPELDPLRFVRPLPRVIAVANQKGGVGKTTTTVNLGASLAVLGYRVLVIDLDPQGNATTGLGINSRNLESSIYDVILHDLPLEDCVESSALRNLFVAPATIDLAGAEIELVPAFSRELRLRRALEQVADDYEFVLIDCPPSLGLLTVNALSAATEVVVPIQCEYYALEGLGQLLRNVNLVQANLNPKLELSAIVLTMYDARTKLAEQVADEVREHFGDKVCRNVVPRTVRLSEAPSFGQPIIVFDPSSRGALAYRELAREVSGGPPQRTG